MSALDRARLLPLGDDDWVEAALDPQAYRVVLRELLAEIDAHFIDTRRLAALGGRDDVAVTLEVDGDDGWTVYRRASWSDQPWQMGYGRTAADALAAAEREAT